MMLEDPRQHAEVRGADASGRPRGDRARRPARSLRCRRSGAAPTRRPRSRRPRQPAASSVLVSPRWSARPSAIANVDGGRPPLLRARVRAPSPARHRPPARRPGRSCDGGGIVSLSWRCTTCGAEPDAERRAAGQQAVQRRGEAVDVGGRTALLLEERLGRREPGRARGVALVAGLDRDADVDQHRAIALAVEQDVRRLDVAVDQAEPRASRRARRRSRARSARPPRSATTRRARAVARRTSESGWPSTSSITK